MIEAAGMHGVRNLLSRRVDAVTSIVYLKPDYPDESAVKALVREVSARKGEAEAAEIRRRQTTLFGDK